MKKYLIGISAGLALCLAGSVFASGDHFAKPLPVVHPDRAGLVVGGDLGYGEINTVESFNDLNDYFGRYNEDYSHSYGGFVWGVNLGYNFNITNSNRFLLGLEVGYKNLGGSQYSNKTYAVDMSNTVKSSYNTQAIDELITAHYYLWQGWNVFAKAGLAELYTDYSAENRYNADPGVMTPPGAYDESNTTWNLRPEYILGTGYTFDFTPNVHMDVHVLYDHIGTESVAGSTTDPSGFSMNVPGANLVMGGVSLMFSGI